MISTSFTYDGITSASMGIYLVKKDSDMFPVPYFPSRTIQEDYPSRATAPYFYRTQLEPQSFTLTFAPISGQFTSTILYNVAKWLFKGTHRPFIPDDNTNKIYYCLAVSKTDFITNGLNEGYIDVEFRCKHPYAFKPTVTEVYDYRVTLPSSVVLTNNSNVFDYYYPEVTFTLPSGVTSLTLTNVTDGNRATTFTGLNAGETIYMNNEKKQIISDTGLYRLGTFNMNWFRLLQGDNTITVSQKCYITIIYNFPVFT